MALTRYSEWTGLVAGGPFGRSCDHLQNRWSASLAMSTDGSFPSRPRQFLNSNRHDGHYIPLRSTDTFPSVNMRSESNPIRFAEVAGPHYPCLNRLLAPEGLKYPRIGEFCCRSWHRRALPYVAQGLFRRG